MLLVNPWACVLGALLLLTVPLPWLAAAVLAAAFHELCHWAVICLLGGSVDSIGLGPGGAVMSAQLEGKWQEALAALAGPLGSISLLTLKTTFPEIALCALAQGLYNLLPVYPMDGGRVLRCFLDTFCPGYRETVETGICLFLMIAAFAAAFFLGWGILPAVLLACLVFKRKSPCKREKIRVQYA